MGNNLIKFNFKNNKVRTFVNNNKEIWFCLIDVCNILDIKNNRDVLSRLNRNGVDTTDGVDSLGRKNNITFINEPNLYRVIFQSRKRIAEKFQNWVFEKVLPSIRKTGSYNIDDRNTLEWEQIRLEGKWIRKNLTDSVKEFEEYAINQGSNGSKWYYKHITSAMNKSLFKVKSLNKISKNLRDEINKTQLSYIITLEKILANQMIKMIKNNVHYKEIYEKLKNICLEVSKLIGQEKPAYISKPEFVKCLSKKDLKKLKSNKHIL